MLRLFLGLTFNSGYTRRLCTLMEGVDGVHWQPQDNLNLTLRFLGDVSLDDAEDLDVQLARITAPAFDLALQGVGWFGIGDRVQNLHALSRPDPILDGLKRQVDRACQHAGFAPEQRKFKPHITLARSRAVRLESAQTWLADHVDFRLNMGDVEAFHMISSHSSSAGRAYRVEASYPLTQMWA